MANKPPDQYKEIQSYSKNFLTRFVTVFLALLTLVLYTYISSLSKYGYSISGKAHHAFLDYPNEISSKDAIELSTFMESLDMKWKVDTKINQPLDKVLEQSDEHYWEKTVDVKDPFQRSKVIQKVAVDLGLPASKFPVRSPQVKLEKINGGLPKTTAAIHQHIANPPDYLKIKQPPRAHLMECADIKKLHHDKTKLISVDPDQFGRLNIQLDGLFSDGGKVNIRTATPAEETHSPTVRVNLSLYAHTDDLFKHVSISELEGAGTKNIHIRNHHPSALKSCLVYQMDIIFPSKLRWYRELNISINHAHHIGGDLKHIAFSKFSAGLGRGAIHFQNLKADHTILGTLNGIILGKYLPVKSFGAAAIKGATNIELAPQSKYVKSTVATLNGPVKVNVQGGVSKSSGFTAHCWLCIPDVESISDPKDVHVTFSRRESIKTGYFREMCSAHVQVHSRYGESKLMFA